MYIQRASTAYYRCVLESVHYLMRRKGLVAAKAKRVSFAIRLQMISMLDNDLRFVSSVSGSDTRLIKMACEQLAYTAVKHNETKREQLISIAQLAEIKKRVDAIGRLALIQFTLL